MTKPINLRQARKRKAREDTARQAEANRVAHGTPKAVRDLEAARRDKLAKQVDGHRLQSPEPELPHEPGKGELRDLAQNKALYSQTGPGSAPRKARLGREFSSGMR